MKIPVRLSALRKSDRGAALIELALVTPILFFIMFAALDWGWLWFTEIQLTGAAHAGAEYGSTNPTDTTGITDAAAVTIPLVTPNPTVVSYGCECSDGGSTYSANCTSKPTCTASATRGSNVVYEVQVTVSGTYTTIVPWKYLGMNIPSSIPVAGSATIRGNYP